MSTAGDSSGTIRLRMLGAFARIYVRDSADALAEAFVADQLVQVQLNLSALGLPTIPTAEEFANLDTAAIQAAFTSRGRVIWGVSATYNTAHPDPGVREDTTAKAAYFIASLGALQPVAATLCTGTRDPDNMWRPHPDNTTEAAWTDMRRSLDELIPAARQAGVLLAVEPVEDQVPAREGAAVAVDGLEIARAREAVATLQTAVRPRGACGPARGGAS